MKRIYVACVSVLLSAGVGLSGCSAMDQTSSQARDKTVTVLTHDSFALSEERKAQFEKQTGYTLKTTAPGDAGMVLNQLILNKDNPTVDAVFGIDNMSAQQAVDSGVIAAYQPKVDPRAQLRVGGLTAIDLGDVCLNADTAWFASHGVAVPQGFDDLVDPRYRNLLVVTNPVTSSPGLAFLAGTIVHAGEQWPQYWSALFANGVKVDDSWSTAFNTDFSAGEGKGAYPLALSYASSPAYGQGAFESVLGTCVRQVEYAGVVTGAKNEAGARAFVDFLLEDQTQQEIPQTMYMYPVANAPLPADWEKYAQLAPNPIVPDPATVKAHREAWQKQWTQLFESR
ncbi:thiamine ABC transporter substrate binding subunit [Trueperella sp. LYQ143]|uniref:thiamine ABC transporter substrate-binding protein n=1 Tax=Trueperella sp. LYQ143 TaxID=3391059 RepID=UPI00398355EC